MITRRYSNRRKKGVIRSDSLYNELLEKMIKILGKEHELIVENGEIKEIQKKEVRK